MKNRIVIVFCLCISAFSAFSQNNQLIIEGSGGKFYLDHTVVAKENWYSIGRLFNLSPHDIANYNQLNFEKPLDVSQQLKIPLTPANFDQKQIKAPGETLVPIYHVVDQKEWMYKVSSMYNDVAVTNLEKWNNIKRDDLKKGTPLIVGFLKVKTDLSPLAVGITSNPAVNAPADNPAATATAAKTSTATPVTPAIKTSAATPSSTPVATQVKPAATAVATQAVSATSVPVTTGSERVNNYAITHSNGGFFSADYAGGVKTANGLAGTFKSTSGWSDGKYYALMNGIAVGTIIRVTGSNNKTIYAKVLGQLPEMKESAGLLIRISNAASAELGLGEGKFPVDVKY